jgi:hypothetical protein
MRLATYESGRATLAGRLAGLDERLAGLDEALAGVQRTLAAAKAARPAGDAARKRSVCPDRPRPERREARPTVELSERCIDNPLGCR